MLRPSTRVDSLPLFAIMPYLFATLALFYLGPYSWPLRAWWIPALYVPACFGALALGFLWGAAGVARGAVIRWGMTSFHVGALSALVLLVPLTLVYTGKLPWDLSAAWSDQRGAYSALADQLADTTGRRGPIVVLRGLTGPFILCVLPLTAMLWPRLSRIQRTLGIATGLAYIDLSVLRGTTAPLADIAVLLSSGMLVRIGIAARDTGLAGLSRHWKLLAGVAIVAALILTALVGRTEARLGGQKISCLANSGACVDLANGVYGRLGDSAAFGAAAVTGYFSQGYYGLSLAAEKPWLPTWGIGHSPLLAAFYVQSGGSEAFANRTYTYRARWDGWSDETQWSTLMAWLANDVGLWGAPFLILALGCLLGRTWIDATRAGDLRAALFFSLLLMIVFYLPANAYVFSSIDTYAAVLFWGLAWAVGRQRRAAA